MSILSISSFVLWIKQAGKPQTGCWSSCVQVSHVTFIHISLAEASNLGISEFYTMGMCTSFPERVTAGIKIWIFVKERYNSPYSPLGGISLENNKMLFSICKLSTAIWYASQEEYASSSTCAELWYSWATILGEYVLYICWSGAGEIMITTIIDKLFSITSLSDNVRPWIYI